MLVEEEKGVLENVLSLLYEEDRGVVQSFVAQAIRLVESTEFVNTASREYLHFYSCLLLTMAKTYQTSTMKQVSTTHH